MVGVFTATVMSHPNLEGLWDRAPGREEVSSPSLEGFLDMAAQSHSCPDLVLGRSLLCAGLGDIQRALCCWVLCNSACHPGLSPVPSHSVHGKVKA